MVYFFFVFLVSFKYLNTNAAIPAPKSGATINSHTCESASPPWITAGAKLLAGLTEVPVNEIPIKWTKIKMHRFNNAIN